MKRREFLKYMTAVGALSAGSNWVVDRVWSRMQSGLPAGDLVEPEGLESWTNSICQLCPGGCGVKVRSVDGVPVKIEGNPLYPLNRGGLCPVGHSGLQMLYNPDRLRGPMRRTGGSGHVGWEPIVWDEALNMIQDKLISMRRSGNCHRLAFIDGGSRGISEMVFRLFMTAYGSPNYIRTDDWENRKTVYRLIEGRDRMPCFDLERTQFALSFGADLLGAETSLVWFSRLLSAMRRNPDRPRGRLIQIEPRLSITGVKADKWVPVIPGTEGALALGIAYMIIQEGLYDKEFVDKYTFGFEDWTDSVGDNHMGFRRLVLSEYHPEAVSRITGVPIEDILLLARGFAENKPSVAICGRLVARYSNGLYSQAAVHALNALVGNIGRPGGIITPTGFPFGDWPKPELDDIARSGLSRPRCDGSLSTSSPLAQNLPSNLAAQILADQPYPLEMVFLYKSNPVFDFAESEKTKEALQKIPFLVSFNSFLDESAEFAHLILPQSLYLERWQGDSNVHNIYFNYFGVSEPVIQPIGDTKPAEDVVIGLAKALGGKVSESLPHKDFFSLIQWAANRIYESERGAIAKGGFYENWSAYMEKRGWRPPRDDTFEEFWQHLIDYGAWVDPVLRQVSPRNAFDTPSKRFEFYVLGLKKALEKQALSEQQLKHLKIQARGEAVYLPHHEPPRFAGDEFEYPYQLIPYEMNIVGDGTVTDSPLLLEMIGFRQYVRWDSWAEIGPEAADEIGVSEGDRIWMESTVGKVKVRVHVYPGTQPDTVTVPVGLGHTALGRFAKNLGINPNTILASDFDRMSGIPSRLGTRVKIYSARD